MKKRLLTLIVVLSTMNASFAQKWILMPFLEVNYTFGNFDNYRVPTPFLGGLSPNPNPNSYLIDESREVQGKPGFAVGAVVQREVGKFFLESGVVAKNINYQLESTSKNSTYGVVFTGMGTIYPNIINGFSHNYTSDNYQFYVGVPLKLGYSISDRISVSAGTNAYYLLHAAQMQTTNSPLQSDKNYGRSGLNDFLFSTQAAMIWCATDKIQLGVSIEKNLNQYFKSSEHIYGQIYQFGIQVFVDLGK